MSGELITLFLFFWIIAAAIGLYILFFQRALSGIERMGWVLVMLLLPFLGILLFTIVTMKDKE